jgi:hypothetical protein
MTDDLDERLSRRFEDEADEESADSQSQTDMSSQSDPTSQKAQNIKNEWNVRSIYLPDDLDSDLSTAFKRLDLELSEADADIALKKTRHFYPLVVALGMEQLESMDITEVTERLEGEDFHK